MSWVSLRGPLVAARFVERPNRFLVRCRLEEDGSAVDEDREGRSGGEGLESADTAPAREIVEAHLPDPGRLEELLVGGRRMRLRPATSPTRKTDWTAVLVEDPAGQGWVSLDTTLPNRLVERALRDGRLDELGGWDLEACEVTLGNSRFDFVLCRPGAGDVGSQDSPVADDDGDVTRRDAADGDAVERLVLEVKSVTLVEDGLGLFPDAVTARGARHVRELGEIAASGDRGGAVLFLIQREDAEAVMAAPSIDPDFASALDEARREGVRVLARRCRVDTERVELGERVPVRWPDDV